jgi:hypothetical protein
MVRTLHGTVCYDNARTKFYGWNIPWTKFSEKVVHRIQIIFKMLSLPNGTEGQILKEILDTK